MDPQPQVQQPTTIDKMSSKVAVAVYLTVICLVLVYAITITVFYVKQQQLVTKSSLGLVQSVQQDQILFRDYIQQSKQGSKQ